jgi:hypothetical protein
MGKIRSGKILVAGNTREAPVHRVSELILINEKRTIFPVPFRTKRIVAMTREAILVPDLLGSTEGVRAQCQD